MAKNDTATAATPTQTQNLDPDIIIGRIDGLEKAVTSAADAMTKEARKLHNFDARLQTVEEHARITPEAPEGFLAKTAYYAGSTVTTQIRLHDVLAAGGAIAAWRGAAHLLETRVALPVGLWADLIAGVVGVSIVRGVVYFVRK